MTRNTLLIALILVLFAVALMMLDNSSGTDLTASYISCRLIQSHQQTHLYAHDESSFNALPDPEWYSIARSTGVPETTMLAPFVQTPLWPYALQPLCGRTTFPVFNLVFLVLLSVCMAGLIWLIGYYWAPRFFQPLWVLLFAAAWVRANPLHDAVILTQTHVLFVLLTFTAILCARSDRPVWAGLALALAAAVKITPAAIVLYWLMTRQRKAALSFILCSAALLGLTVVLTGHATSVAYAQDVSRMSNTLLIDEGNQSLAAWWMGHMYFNDQLFGLTAFRLPPALKICCLGLVVVSTMVGGICDRRLAKLKPGTPPYGAVFAVLGATVFTPIAWPHYYLILVVPLILLFDEYLRDRSYAVLLLSGSIFLLANYRMLQRHAGDMHLPTPNIVWGQFYAGILALVGMLLLIGVHWRSSEALKESGGTRVISPQG